VLGALHAEDFLQLDAGGQIRAAYPFSAVPTPHRVDLDGGPRVHAMCAIDALGIAAMIHAAVTITSADPHTGGPVTITSDQPVLAAQRVQYFSSFNEVPAR